jgi:hypothetical protein
MLTFIETRGAGDVRNTAVEHGFLITISNFVSTYLLSTVAVKVCE